MVYEVEWSETAKKNLEKLDRITKKKIIYKVENYLAEDPHGRGKPLKGNLKGQYRYRFSKYRVIYKIFQTKVVIEILEIGSRSNIYE